MSSGESSPTLTTSGLACPHLLQQSWLCCAAQGKCRICSPECCSWWRGRSSSPVLTTSGPVLPPASGFDGGGHLFPALVAMWQLRDGTRSPTLTFSGLAHLYPHQKGHCSAVLPRRGAWPAFPGVAAGEGERLAPLPAGDSRAKGEGHFASFTLSHCR